MPTGSGLWIYRDASGTNHVAQALEDIPEALRGTAKPVSGEPVGQVLGDSPRHPDVMANIRPEAGTSGSTDIHVPSFLLGGAEFLLVVFMVRAILRTGVASKVALTILLLMAVAFGYAAFVHHQTHAPLPDSKEHILDLVRATLHAARTQVWPEGP